jgi:hypothetical protein
MTCYITQELKLRLLLIAKRSIDILLHLEKIRKVAYTRFSELAEILDR